MVYVYILRSKSTGRYYIGVSESPDDRLIAHNRGQTKSTRDRGPWALVLREAHDNRSSALAREREIKGWKSHTRINNLVGSASR